MLYAKKIHVIKEDREKSEKPTFSVKSCIVNYSIHCTEPFIKIFDIILHAGC
ncbi:hypothetical protein CAXC1_180059 [Candidatus Xenohaliotis californiensis]|uniref:Uncharacterized protein n=1 Tax=Candidatus Xenohaliotis californiensis TaxID=84677 RepID=A0ABM9N8B7_9RICK|nr:hypothetical protein CAXC1_180059 [Candidatus Xenohaliotis californiensis]